MCGAIIVLGITIGTLDIMARRELRAKARHIVIASAAFDKDGKILSRADGTLPMAIIHTDAHLNVSCS
jgi:hypothetical protein